jgi:hypothetical protein
MNSDFEELLSVFNRNDLRYLIVGGHAVMLYTGGRPAWFIGRSDLIENKRATGRPIDLPDLDLLQ